jgi:pantetheine-phosphate adenylyltransferase
MRRAIYPGSFDPVTNGHLDIVERGSKLFDEIIIAVLVNPEKRALFTVEERREMLEEALAQVECSGCRLRVDSFQGLLMRYAVEQRAHDGVGRLRVGSFQGLLMRYAVEQQAHAVVRGIRAISDYEYELQMALMNRRQEPGIETVFMLAAESYSYVSSRLVKEVYSLGGTIEGLVPATVEERMRLKLGKG